MNNKHKKSYVELNKCSIYNSKIFRLFNFNKVIRQFTFEYQFIEFQFHTNIIISLQKYNLIKYYNNNNVSYKILRSIHKYIDSSGYFTTNFR